MRQSAYSIGRAVFLLAVIIVCCCLSGCGIIQGAIGDLDTQEDAPANWRQLDEQEQTLDASKDLSLSSVLSKPAFVYASVAIRPAVSSG
jgi:hypothetical protein